MLFIAQNVNNAWQNGNKNNEHYNREKVAINVGNHIAKKKAKQGDTDPPQNSPNDIEHKKRLVVHITNTGNDGCKGADHRYKARDDDSLAAMFFIEVLGARKVLFVEDERVLPGKKLDADFIAK